MTGPSPRTRETVIMRSNGVCELCHQPLRQFSVHHRRPRQMGGTKRPESNMAANLLVICGSGTTGCHGHIESMRSEAYESGVLLRSMQDPESEPYRDNYGHWWTLTNNGTKTRQPPLSQPLTKEGMISENDPKGAQ
jgi:hypothetical protein